MANRLTKGKALIGSLDVQGELTINGAPVGSGGGGSSLILTHSPEYTWSRQGASGIVGLNQYNLIAGDYEKIPAAGIMPGDRFDVTYEIFSPATENWTKPFDFEYATRFEFLTAVAVYDMMYNATIILVSSMTVNGSYMNSLRTRFTLKKVGF